MHPFLAPDFHIRWSTLTPEHIEPDIRHALDLSKMNIEAICSQDLTTATYHSTFVALEQATEVLGRGWGRLQHLDSVNDNPAQREGLNKMLPEVSDFYSSIPLNARLWHAIKSVAASPAVASLTPVQQRFVGETLADFQQAGADLPPAQKLRIAAIDAELSKLTQSYAEHVLDSTNAWELIVDEEAKLAGLPDSTKAAAAANARAKAATAQAANQTTGDDTKTSAQGPTWRFTLHAPSMVPVMQHLHDDAIRHHAVEEASRRSRRRIQRPRHALRGQPRLAAGPGERVLVAQEAGHRRRVPPLSVW